MAAYWQGYGTLGVGENAGAVAWDSMHSRSAEREAARKDQMREGSLDGKNDGNARGFMSAFAGQGQLPFQVRRRIREQKEEKQRQLHLHERGDLLQV